MRKPKPCQWCGGSKPPGKGARVCGRCRFADTIWGRMTLGAGDCWLWTGPVYKGYGQATNDQPHRIAYTELIGDIPDGLHLDHLCRTPACCNPWHLEPVTPAENTRRKWAVYTHCKNGHEFTEANTYRNPSGARNCRTCGCRSQREYQARKAARTGT